jgi:hypothetical protein
MMSIDASYEYGFGVAVYQVPKLIMEEFGMTVEQVQKGDYDRRRDRVIMFLSKELTAAETTYWPTELETSALVFAVKKTRHLVEANDYPTIIYTDHVAVRHVAHSTTLKTASPERANMRLIRGSQYLSQFRLDVRYTPGKSNVVADALSRLKRVEMKTDIFTVINDIIPDQDRPEDTESQIHMSPEFLERWSTGLRDDRHYRTIFAELEEKIGDADEVEAYGWLLKNSGGKPLLFVRKGETGLRACVPANLVQELLKAAHDKQGHPGIETTFSNIRDHFYMPRMSAVVRTYVSSCPECAKKRTANHKPYGKLQPIEPPVRPFSMLTIDFITKLPPAMLHGVECDAILTATDKTSRAVIFIPGREDWNAASWADVLLRDVIRRWGIPTSIISDRGSVFVSELWKSLFAKLDVSLLFSTSYHPQTDGQSEATNKYLQAMLRFFVNERQDDWVQFLGEAEFLINNSRTAATKMAPNEILFGFKLRDTVSALAKDFDSTMGDTVPAPVLRALARADAEDASTHAAYHIARNYNRKHKDLSLKVGDKAYIGLGTGYKLRGIPKAKLGLQRVGPFNIVEKVGRLAYKLDLPDGWKIHPVISIVHLEPAKDDPFGREVVPPPPVEVEGEEYWKIETIIRRELRGRGRNRRIHYLVRWKGYGPEFDEWLPVEEMEHSGELVEEFESRQKDRMNVNVIRGG